MANNISIGSKYYMPFWILLEFLDAAPPDPFVEVQVVGIYEMSSMNGDQKHTVECCDLIINNKKNLTANNIPTEFLINEDDLKSWAERISDWFLGYNKNEN